MKENKGFSLVELIVVVAIMAVLVGILAPAYLSYVEKTRRGTDESAGDEIRRAIETAVAEVKVYDEVDTGASFTFSNGTTITSVFSNYNNLKASMEDVFSDKKFELKSKLYKPQTYTVTIKAPSGNSGTGTGAALIVDGAFSAAASTSN